MAKYKRNVDDTQSYIDSVLNDEMSDINVGEYIAFELDKQKKREKRRNNKIKNKKRKKFFNEDE